MAIIPDIAREIESVLKANFSYSYFKITNQATICNIYLLHLIKKLRISCDDLDMKGNMHGCKSIYLPEFLPSIIVSNILLQIFFIVLMKEYRRPADHRHRGSAGPTSHRTKRVQPDFLNKGIFRLT